MVDCILNNFLLISVRRDGKYRELIGDDMKYFIFLISIALLLTACSKEEKYPGLKLSPGTSAYDSAKKLAVIYPFLDPEKNLPILKCRWFNITVGDVIDEIDFFLPSMIDNMLKDVQPNNVKKVLLFRARQTALRKLALREAMKENITIKKSKIDNLMTKFRIIGIAPSDMPNYLKTKGKTEEYIRSWITDNVRIDHYYKNRLKDMVTISKKEVRELYDAAEYLNVRYIVLSTNNLSESQRIKKRAVMERVKQLYKDGFDFGELAEKYSEDTETALYGGLLKGVRRGRFPEKVEKIIFNMREGEVSKIIETNDQIYLFKLEKHVKETRPFDDVYKVYESQLMQQKMKKANMDIADKLFEKAGCRISAQW